MTKAFPCSAVFVWIIDAGQKFWINKRGFGARIIFFFYIFLSLHLQSYLAEGCLLWSTSPLLFPLSLHTGLDHWRWWEDLHWSKWQDTWVHVMSREITRRIQQNAKVIFKLFIFLLKDVDHNLTRPAQVKINGLHFGHSFCNNWQADLWKNKIFIYTVIHYNYVDVTVSDRWLWAWPQSLPHQSVGRWPYRRTGRRPPGSPTSDTAGCCYLGPVGEWNEEKKNINKENLLNSRRW